MKNEEIRIGELASMFGLTIRTIRFYEEIGLLEPSGRSNGSHRRYSGKSVIHLRRIQQLKEYGLTLSEISDLFALSRERATRQSVKPVLVNKYKEKLSDALKKKKLLEEYINDLEWHINQIENVKDFFECPGKSCETCSFSDRCTLRETNPEG